MEETNFVLLWKEHYQKIDESLTLNKRLLRELISQKADSAIRSLIREKAFGIVAGVIYLLILGTLLTWAIAHYSHAANYFLVSIGCIFLINIKAVYDYIRHLFLIHQIRYDENVKETQHKLRQLRLSLLHHSRILVLQFPFWTTFYLSDTWFPRFTSVGWIVFQVSVTSFFTWLALWLYQKHTPANLDNWWVRLFFRSVGGRTVLKMQGFYKELEDLED